MASRTFLTVSDVDRIYPSFQNPSFDVDKHTVLASIGLIPMLWLCLFRERDLVEMEFQGDDGPIPAFAPLTTLEQGLSNLREVGPLLNETFAPEGGLTHHLTLFADYLAIQAGRYVTIGLSELEFLYVEGGLRTVLRAALRALDEQENVLTPLLTLSEVRLGRRFVTLAERRSAECAPEDRANYYNILGDHWIQRPPWDPPGPY